MTANPCYSTDIEKRIQNNTTILTLTEVQDNTSNFDLVLETVLADSMHPESSAVCLAGSPQRVPLQQSSLDMMRDTVSVTVF